ncbi:MAG: hypothetical protein HYU37_22520 [Acidobacteria bacterium]|nr:hypothetical protein [Acidobacteriota bacterium]
MLACAALGFPLAAAQSSLEPEQEGKRIRALRVQEPIRVDGSLSEPAWYQVPPASDFLQREPVEGGAPTETTEVRVLYDDTYLYLGFRLLDSDPDEILATDRRRDSQMQGDDTIAVILGWHQAGHPASQRGRRQPRVGRGVGRGGPDHRGGVGG